MTRGNSPKSHSSRIGPLSNLGDYPSFSARVARRLKAGAEAYGDASFEASATVLIDEIQQELLDVNAWSYILWQRLEKIRKVISARRLDDLLNDVETSD